MAEEKVYTRVKEAEEMIKKICAKQPDVCWCVKPNTIAVYAIENKERPKHCRVDAKIRPIKGSQKAIFQDNGIPFSYVIEVYWSDWNIWKEKKKQWLLLHEILHIASEEGKTLKHDCEDFKIILDKVGVNWSDNTAADNLPSLVDDDVKFNLALRPSLEDVDVDDDDDEKDEKGDKKEGKEGKDGKDGEEKE